MLPSVSFILVFLFPQSFYLIVIAFNYIEEFYVFCFLSGHMVPCTFLFFYSAEVKHSVRKAIVRFVLFYYMTFKFCTSDWFETIHLRLLPLLSHFETI